MKSVVLILDLTNDCNLRCKYCYISGGEKQEYMSVESAILAIDKIYNKYKCLVNVLFHGGEPLLCFEAIKKIVDEINKRDYKSYIKWMIQTNGLLITPDISRYLKNSNINIGISIDGFDDKANALRITDDNKMSTNRVIEAIKILKKEGINVSILSVINSCNWDKYTESIRKFVDLGIRSFTFNPYISAGRGEKAKLGVTNEQMFEAYKQIIELMLWYYEEKGICITEKNIYYMLKKLLTGRSGYMCMTSPCGAGIAQFTMDANGDMYPCADFCGIEKFKIGNVKEDFFKKIANNEEWRKIRSYHLEINDECKECELKTECMAGCVVRCYFTNQDVLSLDPICEFYKLIIPYLKNEELQKRMKAMVGDVGCEKCN